MTTLRLLCAGAAHGVVAASVSRWSDETGLRLDARFGPVGGLKETLLADTPCDVFIATAAIVGELIAQDRLDGATATPLGRVATGLAVREGFDAPRIDTADALRSAFLDADRLFLPDPQRATAGIHFISVLRRLGVHDALAARLSTHPSGAAAMRAMAATEARAAIGCTQVSEILDTAGVRLVGPLPAGYDLATPYVAAVCVGAHDRAAAVDFVARVAGPAAVELRRACGFEPFVP
ncbi:MAG TPA: substrate-binding domain-containing protein [Caldimonas sp.]|nr:substrate-binding domain-containing protein [Caldimonas sp.]